jgi:hypothetical protein
VKSAGQDGDVLTQRQVEERNGRAHRGDQALLLRDVELGRGAGIEPLLDQRQHVGGGLEVLAGNPQLVLGREHLKIGSADRGNRRENHDVLVEAAGDGGLLGGARGGAVLAPEIDLVAGIERGPQGVALDPARRLRALHEPGEIDRRQQRRAGDLG